MLSLLEFLRKNLINVNSVIQLRLIWGYVSQSGIKLRIFTKQLIIEKDTISYGNREKRDQILRPTIYLYFFHSIPTLSASPIFIKCEMIVPNWYYNFWFAIPFRDGDCRQLSVGHVRTAVFLYFPICKRGLLPCIHLLLKLFPKFAELILLIV